MKSIQDFKCIRATSIIKTPSVGIGMTLCGASTWFGTLGSPILCRKDPFLWPVDRILRRKSVCCFSSASMWCWLQCFTVELAGREIGISAPTHYKWQKRYIGMSVHDGTELKELRVESARIKRLVADSELEKLMLKQIAKKNGTPCLAQQRNFKPFCCSEKHSEHQNGSRATSLDLPDQQTAGRHLAKCPRVNLGYC